jgi:hypothetical protein
MDRYIHRENLRLFRKRLENKSLSETERKIILMLLAEEQAKRPRSCDTGTSCVPTIRRTNLRSFS